MSVNKVILVCTVVAQPEIRHSQNGKAIANMRVVTSETWKDKATGEKNESSEFHRVVSFNEGLNRVIEQHIEKGSKLYIEGSLQTRKYQAQDGTDRYSTEIVMQNFGGKIDILTWPDNAKSETTEPQGNTQGAMSTQHTDLDDDIPF